MYVRVSFLCLCWYLSFQLRNKLLVQANHQKIQLFLQEYLTGTLDFSPCVPSALIRGFTFCSFRDPVINRGLRSRWSQWPSWEGHRQPKATSHACVIHVTSSHQVDISSSHSITRRRRVSSAQYLRRHHTHITLTVHCYHCCITSYC